MFQTGNKFNKREWYRGGLEWRIEIPSFWVEVIWEGEKKSGFVRACNSDGRGHSIHSKEAPERDYLNSRMASDIRKKTAKAKCLQPWRKQDRIIPHEKKIRSREEGARKSSDQRKNTVRNTNEKAHKNKGAWYQNRPCAA